MECKAVVGENTSLGIQAKAAALKMDSDEDGYEELMRTPADNLVQSGRRTIPQELIDVITSVCRDRVMFTAITQSASNWRDVLVHGVNAGTIQDELNLVLANHPQFKDFNVVARSEDEPPPNVNYALTVCKKRKQKGTGLWDEVRKAACEMLVITQPQNTVNPYHSGAVYAVVPAHLVLTKNQFDAAGRPDRAWTRPPPIIPDAVMMALEGEDCDHHVVEDLPRDVDVDSNSEDENGDGRYLIAQIRKRAERRTSRRTYTIFGSEDQPGGHERISADLKHPILLSCRQLMYRKADESCPARKCEIPPAASCHHMFMTDMALLPVEFDDALRLQRFLQLQQHSPLSPIYRIHSLDHLERLYEAPQSIRVRNARGTLKRLGLHFDARQDDQTVMGKHLTFILTPGPNGDIDKLVEGDCGSIVYLEVSPEIFRPVGMYVSANMPNISDDIGAGYTDTFYQAVILSAAFKDLQEDYSHLIGDIRKFRVP